MTAIFVTSLSENAGKTMLCAGLSRSWQNSGKKISYVKISSGAAERQQTEQADVSFMQRMLGSQSSAIKANNLPQDVRSVFQDISSGKDIVLFEGLSLNVSQAVIEALGAKVLVLHDYNRSLGTAIAEYKKHGSQLLGIILNKVPRRRLNQVRTLAVDACTKAGIVFLGVLPEDRFLYAITVAELAEVLGGKILNNPEKSGELIEHFMLGAMTFDSGLDYFSLRDNKAVILREERPDMQMAALQTSTRCMVLSGGGQPIPVVAQQAALKKIPLISASGDVPFLVTVLEKALSQVKFNQEKKLPRLVELLKQNLDASLVTAKF